MGRKIDGNVVVVFDQENVRQLWNGNADDDFHPIFPPYSAQMRDRENFQLETTWKNFIMRRNMSACQYCNVFSIEVSMVFFGKKRYEINATRKKEKI